MDLQYLLDNALLRQRAARQQARAEADDQARQQQEFAKQKLRTRYQALLASESQDALRFRFLFEQKLRGVFDWSDYESLEDFRSTIDRCMRI